MLTSLAPSPMAKVTAFRLFLTNCTTNAYKTVKTSALDLTFPWNSFRDRFRTWTVARIAQFGKHHTAVMFRSLSEFKSIALFPHACIDRTLRPSIVPTVKLVREKEKRRKKGQASGVNNIARTHSRGDVAGSNSRATTWLSREVKEPKHWPCFTGWCFTYRVTSLHLPPRTELSKKYCYELDELWSERQSLRHTMRFQSLNQYLQV